MLRIESTRFVLSAVGEKDFPEDAKPQIAFVGRSNVGKSTLLNRLLGQKALARISSKPGKTRAVNYFLINSRFYFVDLPGFGYAKVSKTERREWADLMDSYFRQSLSRTQVVQLVDGKVGATPLDLQAAEYFRELGATPIVVATKVDRISRNKRKASLDRIRRDLEMDGERRPIAFAAPTGEGSRELWQEIEAFLFAAESGVDPLARVN